MEKSKQQKNKVRFVVVREFSGEKSMREAFEQLIERQTCDCLLYTSRKGAWLSGGGNGRKNRLKSGCLREK